MSNHLSNKIEFDLWGLRWKRCLKAFVRNLVIWWLVTSSLTTQRRSAESELNELQNTNPPAVELLSDPYHSQDDQPPHQCPGFLRHRPEPRLVWASEERLGQKSVRNNRNSVFKHFSCSLSGQKIDFGNLSKRKTLKNVPWRKMLSYFVL